MNFWISIQLIFHFFFAIIWFQFECSIMDSITFNDLIFIWIYSNFYYFLLFFYIYLFNFISISFNLFQLYFDLSIHLFYFLPIFSYLFLQIFIIFYLFFLFIYSNFFNFFYLFYIYLFIFLIILLYFSFFYLCNLHMCNNNRHGHMKHQSLPCPFPKRIDIYPSHSRGHDNASQRQKQAEFGGKPRKQPSP